MSAPNAEPSPSEDGEAAAPAPPAAGDDAAPAETGDGENNDEVDSMSTAYLQGPGPLASVRPYQEIGA